MNELMYMHSTVCNRDTRYSKMLGVCGCKKWLWFGFQFSFAKICGFQFSFGFTKIKCGFILVWFSHCVLNVYALYWVLSSVLLQAMMLEMTSVINWSNYCEQKWLRTWSAEIWHEKKYFDCWFYNVWRWSVNKTRWKLPQTAKVGFWRPNCASWVLGFGTFRSVRFSSGFRKLTSDIFIGFCFCTPLRNRLLKTVNMLMLR